LVVDEGEGTMISVAYRWAMGMLEASATGGASRLDARLVFDRLQRLRGLAQLFSTNRRALTDVKSSVGTVQESLETMRNELLGLVDELSTEVQRSAQENQ
ncbi:MAG: hypothetical protein ACRD02_09390, partial [Acidimicrobiia bacterium]